MSHETSDIAIALIGVLSMVLARLLDWYFPLGRHRSRRQISEENKRKAGDD